uniref:Glutamine-dependent NAD(+) synthetase n=3 Tax=Physcomitrium patens TaxID=3218 RepID=A0A7I4BDN0_PHYPA
MKLGGQSNGGIICLFVCWFVSGLRACEQFCFVDCFCEFGGLWRVGKMRVVKLATCSLNQWAMDFEGNLARTKQSIREARNAGATFRVGPELELCGYGCEDHFLEGDTLKHSWECMAEILASDLTNGIVCDIGLPVEECGVRYNCRAYCLDGQILLVRPKLYLANDGNYRELRWFSSWKRLRELETYQLPECIREVTGQETVPFGDGYLSFEDTGVASETCEELFTPSAPHIGLSLGGVEIIANGSGSHHQLRKLNTRIELMQSATSKCGGVYMYANQQGCDGGRLYYDGCACIMVNGDVVAQGSQFSMKDVEVVTACVDLDAVSSFRGTISSLREQASQEPRTPSIAVKFKLSRPMNMANHFPSLPIKVRYHDPYEEIALGPACWLWDYLRRSGATGYLLPLSGGADSSSVAAIVGCMCQLVVKAVREGDKQVIADAIRMGNYRNDEVPESADEFAQRLLHTVYMGTENSSHATRDRAKRLAGEIGASHLNVNIDVVVKALLTLFESVFPGRKLRYKVHGGTQTENLALQNIQARIRMVIAFMLASLMPWVRSKPGFLLVLGSANVDEGLRGYLTKYDCSSADINPIGGISKGDIRAFLRWGALNLGYGTLAEVEGAPPTAELEPITVKYTQTDEIDMGMTYEELGMYGRLRKIFRCGPVSMFENLCIRWHGRLTPAEVAQKVKDFFKYYSINRHKMTTLTPSYHAENYSPEDNRYDLRQFLYNTRWPWQFRRIDQLVDKYETSMPEPLTEFRQHMQPTAAEAAAPNSTGLGVPAASSGNPQASGNLQK